MTTAPVVRLYRLNRVQADRGHAFCAALPADLPLGDSDGQPFASSLLLFEDGEPLGSAHSQHDEIRVKGRGRYSHWANQLWFSTSDNTSPLKNRRLYQVMVPSVGVGGIPSTIDLDSIPPFKRFSLARDTFRQIWPFSALPDFGRQVDLDARFAADFARVCPEADYSFERKYNMDQIARLALRVTGDVAECGTYKGASAFFLARRIQEAGGGRRLCLFDSFAGLSPPDQRDGDWWQAGNLSATSEAVRSTLAPLGDLSFVDIYDGWIPLRFSEVANRRFCLVHIDVDLLAPTRDSLEFFYPRLSKGGIMVFDDYGHQSCPGVTFVVDAFMAGKPEPIVNLASGGAIIVKE